MNLLGFLTVSAAGEASFLHEESNGLLFFLSIYLVSTMVVPFVFV